jgi:cystathionine beta-lyase/cystathionine gamma-synthase
MTRKSIPVSRRRNGGVKDSLIRLSVGLEDAGDLMNDQDQVLKGLDSQSRSIKKEGRIAVAEL